MPTPLNQQQIEELRKALKRCNPEVLEATLRYHNENDVTGVPMIVRGIIEAHLSKESQNPFSEAPDDTRLEEDLGIDSLTRLEIAMLVEEVLMISIPDTDLRSIRTLGDINKFILNTRTEREP